MKHIKFIEIFIVLMVISFAYVFGDVLSNQWKPQWKIGDWWIIKTRGTIWVGPPISKPPDINNLPPWRLYYKVIGIEKINGQECFAVEQRRLPIDEYLPELKTVYYFRKDNLQIVRISSYGYSQGKLQNPSSVNYKYKYKSPFVGNMDFFPSFPLVYKGAEAESLALKRSDPNQAMVSQIVSVRRIEEFNKMIMASDTIYASEGDCYYVHIETWAPDTARRLIETKEIWIPTLPWYLYSETSVYGDGKMTPLFKRWLADYSGWHTNKK